MMVQVTSPTGQLLDPQPQAQASPQGESPEGGSDLAGQWRDWIGRPSNRAALMQFGIAMLQPVGIGQSQIGNIANAIGEGGEAAQRVSQQEMGREKEASQEDLRASQANLAEQRAGAQGTLATAREQAARTAEERLRLAEQGQEQKRQLGRLSATIRAQSAYQQYRNEIARANQQNQFDPKYQPQTPKEFEAWVQDNPILAGQMGYGPRAQQDETPTPPVAEREQMPQQSFQDAMRQRPEVAANIDRWKAVAKSNPNDPRLQSWLQQIKPIFRDYAALRQYLGLPQEGGQ